MHLATALFLCIDALFSCVVWGAMNFGGATIFIGSWQTVKLLGLDLPGFGPREANFCAGMLDFLVGAILMVNVVVPNMSTCERWRYALVLGIPNLIATPIGIQALMSMSGGPAEERKFAEWLGVVFLLFGISQLTLASLPCQSQKVESVSREDRERNAAIQGEREREGDCSPSGNLSQVVGSSHCERVGDSVEERNKSSSSDWTRLEMWVIDHRCSSDLRFLLSSVACAFAMGFLGAAVGTGTPAKLLLFGLARIHPSEQRITYVPAAFSGCLLRLVLLLAANDSELVTLFWAERRLLFAIVGCGALGGWAGSKIAPHIDKESFLTVLLWVVVTSGLVMTRALHSETYEEAGLLSSNVGSACMFAFLLWAELYLLCWLAAWIWSRRRRADVGISSFVRR